MPNTAPQIADNIYKLPGENRHLGLQAGEVAWTGERKHSGWILVAIGCVAVLAAIVAMGNMHG